MFSRHNEKLADHATTLSNVLLHELGAGDTDELAVRVVRDSTCEEGLTRTRWAVQKDTLRLGDTERLEKLWVLDGELDDLLDLLNLFVETANHLVRAVWNFLDHHKGHERVDLVGQDLVYRVRVGAEGDTKGRSELVNVDIGVSVNDYPAVRKGNRDLGRHHALYLPSGWTFTRTLFLPIAFTTSPT